MARSIDTWSRENGSESLRFYTIGRRGGYVIMRGFKTVQDAKQELVRRGIPVGKIGTVQKVQWVIDKECIGDISA